MCLDVKWNRMQESPSQYLLLECKISHYKDIITQLTHSKPLPLSFRVINLFLYSLDQEQSVNSLNFSSIIDTLTEVVQLGKIFSSNEQWLILIIKNFNSDLNFLKFIFAGAILKIKILTYNDTSLTGSNQCHTCWVLATATCIFETIYWCVSILYISKNGIPRISSPNNDKKKNKTHMRRSD